MNWKENPDLRTRIHTQTLLPPKSPLPLSVHAHEMITTRANLPIIHSKLDQFWLDDPALPEMTIFAVQPVRFHIIVLVAITQKAILQQSCKHWRSWLRTKDRSWSWSETYFAWSEGGYRVALLVSCSSLQKLVLRLLIARCKMLRRLVLLLCRRCIVINQQLVMRSSRGAANAVCNLLAIEEMMSVVMPAAIVAPRMIMWPMETRIMRMMFPSSRPQIAKDGSFAAIASMARRWRILVVRQNWAVRCLLGIAALWYGWRRRCCCCRCQGNMET